MKQILITRWVGQFGNNMHQYAYAATWAHKHRAQVVVPNDWAGTGLFVHQAVPLKDAKLHALVKKTANMGRTDITTKAINDYYKNENVPKEKQLKLMTFSNPKAVYDEHADSPAGVRFENLCAYIQDMYKGMSRCHLQSVFAFQPHIVESDVYQYWYKRRGTYDAAHVRRTDFVSCGQFVCVDVEAYKNAMRRTGIDPDGVVWVSDDPKIRKNHLKKCPLVPKTENWGYSHFLEDFLILYFSRTLFRANSSFSLWAGIISPYVQDIWCPDLTGVGDTKNPQMVPFVRGYHKHWFHHSADICIRDDSILIKNHLPGKGNKGFGLGTDRVPLDGSSLEPRSAAAAQEVERKLLMKSDGSPASLTLITYADERYQQELDKFKKLYERGVADSFIAYGPDSIKDPVHRAFFDSMIGKSDAAFDAKRHRSHYDWKTSRCGQYFFKPALILQTLLKMKMGDILVFADTRTRIENPETFKADVAKYLGHNDIALNNTGWRMEWVSLPITFKLLPNGDAYRALPQFSAHGMVFRNTPAVQKLVREWIAVMMTEDGRILLDDSLPHPKGSYQGSRPEQAALTAVIARDKFVVSQYPAKKLLIWYVHLQ